MYMIIDNKLGHPFSLIAWYFGKQDGTYLFSFIYDQINTFIVFAVDKFGIRRVGQFIAIVICQMLF